MTKKYFLQVEAVNIQSFVYDTNDISTIRGGSYVLMDTIKNQLVPWLAKKNFIPIATEASQGLFSFEDGDNVDEVRQRVTAEVMTYLVTSTERHASFQVAVEPDEGDFPEILQRLQARIRRQQLRWPTVPPPQFEATEQEGYLDGWRPGVVDYRVDPNVKGVKISRATDFRRRKGRAIKHQIFEETSGKKSVENDEEWLIARDLTLLAQDSTKGILDGKVAFLHVDGNGFGAIRYRHCTTPEQRTAFDKRVQDDIRKPFLRALLTRALNDRDFQTRDAKGRLALRLEVLLWGGDEMTLIVPAWKGLEVLELFYQQAQGKMFEGEPLTHRGAIIFCHHNAPILLIKRLAEALLERTKEDIAQVDERDAAHYLILESFDALGSSLDSFLTSYYSDRDGTTYPNLLLKAQELADLKQNLHAIVNHAPKNKIFDIIETLQEGDQSDPEALMAIMLASVEPNHRNTVQDAIKNIVGSVPERWCLIADLWDYAKEWK